MSTRSRYTTTKNDLARQVAAEVGLSIDSAEKSITATLTAICRAVGAGQRVELRNFGVFQPRRIKARKCYGMQEGKSIPDSVRFGFRTAGILKNLKIGG